MEHQEGVSLMSMVFTDFKDDHYRYLFNNKRSAERFLKINELDVEYDYELLDNKFYMVMIPRERIAKIDGGVEWV